MARARITTVRLDADDQRALARAKRDGFGASELIRRGLRTVAAGYYGPGAAPSPASADPDTAALRAWRVEREAFGRMPAARLARHRGRWVAVLDGAIADAGVDLDSLSRRMRARAGGRPFFVARVGVDPDVVDMPGFELA